MPRSAGGLSCQGSVKPATSASANGRNSDAGKLCYAVCGVAAGTPLSTTKCAFARTLRVPRTQLAPRSVRQARGRRAMTAGYDLAGRVVVTGAGRNINRAIAMPLAAAAAGLVATAGRRDRQAIDGVEPFSGRPPPPLPPHRQTHARPARAAARGVDGAASIRQRAAGRRLPPPAPQLLPRPAVWAATPRRWHWRRKRGRPRGA
jgi:hypothetical protein